MTTFMPKWHQFDRQAPAILSPTSSGGRIVLLGMTPEFLSGPDAMRLAISVGRSWADSGLLVVLADGCFEDPKLHTCANLPNDGGLGQILLLGTPLQEMVQPGGRPRFHLLTTGINATHQVPGIEPERWTQLTTTIQDEAVTFALMVPLDSDLGQRALDACSDIVLLANSDEEVEKLLPPGEERVREVIGPNWQEPHSQPVLTETGQPIFPPTTEGTQAVGMRESFESSHEEPSVAIQHPHLRRWSGGDRRETPDRRQAIWKEAAEIARRTGELPPGVLYDRRRGEDGDRRVQADRRAAAPVEATPQFHPQIQAPNSEIDLVGPRPPLATILSGKFRPSTLHVRGTGLIATISVMVFAAILYVVFLFSIW